MSLPLVALLLVLSVGTILLETSRRRLRRALAHGSRHDELTGLPNRALFQERAATAFSSSSPRSRPRLSLTARNRWRSSLMTATW